MLLVVVSSASSCRDIITEALGCKHLHAKLSAAAVTAAVAGSLLSLVSVSKERDAAALLGPWERNQ
jgi:hypothetical protein